MQTFFLCGIAFAFGYLFAWAKMINNYLKLLERAKELERKLALMQGGETFEEYKQKNGRV